MQKSDQGRKRKKLDENTGNGFQYGHEHGNELTEF